MTIEHGARVKSGTARRAALACIAAGLVGCTIASTESATIGGENIGTTSSALFTPFNDDFNTSPTTWTPFEEVVGGNTCYGTGIASVRQVSTPRRPPGKTGGSLAVVANDAESTSSNHVLAQKKLPTTDVDVRLDYEAWAMIDARAGDGLHEGQVGPEMSIQRTRLLPEGWRTMTGGVQYIANKWSGQGSWQLWTDAGNGSAGWVTIRTGTVLTPGVWYRLQLKVDYATGMYRALVVNGPDVSFTMDLTTRRIVKEVKFSEDALWLTLESENAWSGCSTVFEYTVNYDDVALTSPDAPPPGQVCTGPSTQACGNCGTQTRTCTKGKWSAWGPCQNEGVCVPGGTQACGNGGTQTCTSSCGWSVCEGQCSGATCTGYADISAGQGAGQFPSAVIDTVNDKLLVVAAHAGSSLFRCNRDGTGCTYTNLTGGRGLGWHSSVLIDPTSSKLLVVSDGNGFSWWRPSLYRCNLDGTDCSYADLSAGQGEFSGQAPSALIDPTNNKLLVVAANEGNGKTTSFFRCELDGSSCTYTDISAGQGPGSAFYPTALLDGVNQKLLVVSNGDAMSRLSLVRCELDGTSCVATDLDAQTGYPTTGIPSAIIDTANGKLLVIDEGPGLTRCELDGSGCTRTDISAGQGAQAAFMSSPVIANGKLLVGVWNVANANKPGLFTCNLDGTSASYTDLSAGLGPDSGRWPFALVDAVSSRFLLVTTHEGDGYKPYLFSAPLP